ncbi:MAG: 16S rRNA (guanine(527)-N(7))-methyltransferase RsmG [Bacilli bacterium]
MNKEEFLKSLSLLNINLTDKQINDLEIYCKTLIEYNEHTNLTAIKTQDEIYLKHFYDSLTLTKIIDFNKYNTLLDIGSGAGFPGLLLKIVFPHLKVTLLDSNNKKTTFLTYISNLLKLNDVLIVSERVEIFSKNNLNKFDIVTARAVTNMSTLVEIALPLVKKDCYFIGMKSKMSDEIKDSYFAIKYMGGVIEDTISFNLLGDEFERLLIKIKKERDTLPKELRTYDKIIKNPLQKSCK